MQVSVFKNTWDTIPAKSADIKSIIRRIKTGAGGIKEQVELVRKLKSEENAQYKEEKKKLPAVTFSGTFEERKISGLTGYSGVLCIDIDHVEGRTLEDIKEKLSVDRYILGYFTSPSGDGLKALVYSERSSKGTHQHFYFSAEKYFKETYGIVIDRACKDVSRLCYVSYDPDAVLFENAEEFPIDFEIHKEEFFIKRGGSGAVHVDKEAELCFKVARKWTERIFIYEDGSKNKYLHNLACTLNRLGVPMDVTIELIDRNYITPDRKWIQSIESAYKHNAHEFSTKTLKEFNDDYEPLPYIEKPYEFGDIEKDIRKYIMRFLETRMPGDLMREYTRVSLLVYKNFFDTDLVKEVGIDKVVDKLIAQATEEWKANELNGITPIHSESLFDAGMDVRNILGQVNEFMVGVEGFDDLVPGLFCPGNLLEVIGRESTYKSVLVHRMAYENSKYGVSGVYVNGEMSKGLFVKRSVKMDSGIDFDHFQAKKMRIPDDVYEDAMSKLKASVGNRLQVHSGTDFTRKGLKDLVTKLRCDGHNIKYMIIDGLSQMADVKNDEIKSAIHNSKELKELAKECDILVIVLVHMKTGPDKTVRDTGQAVRGGSKITANADAYFSTSLFEEQQPDDIQEKEYKRGMFCLRMTDKRGALGVVQRVIDVDPKNLSLKVSNKTVEDLTF